jgi:two-component system, sensor histidine kinase and response regulator
VRARQPLILIAEDDPVMRELVRQVVGDEGYPVETATDGAAALRRIEDGGVGLLLLDLMMPGMDGLEVCRRVRENESGVYLPIVMLTALEQQEQRHAGFSAGADDYITKPFNVRDLIDRVHAWAQTRQRLEACHQRAEATHARLLAEHASRVEAEAALRARTELLLTVTHDLRTPLTAIKGYAQLMRRRGTYSAEAVEAILAQAYHQERMVNGLLQAGRLDGTELELEREPVDLTALAHGVARQLQPLNPTCTIRVEAPEQVRSGQWDRDRVEQVFHNLLANALRHSADGATVLLCIEDLGTEARVSVKDQGSGIAPETLPRLFERFYQVNAADRGRKGLGLGLYIAKSLIEAHGGRIWAESELGVGSSFIFTLPYEPPGEGRGPGSTEY